MVTITFDGADPVDEVKVVARIVSQLPAPIGAWASTWVAAFLRATAAIESTLVGRDVAPRSSIPARRRRAPCVMSTA